MTITKIIKSLTKIVLVVLFGITLTFGFSSNVVNAAVTAESSYQKTDTNAVTNSDKADKYTQPGVKLREKIENTEEDVVDKLNLDEELPRSTKKFFRQIQGKEPIENETRPQ